MSGRLVKTMRVWVVVGVVLTTIRPAAVDAQSSSLFRRASQETPGLSVRPTTAAEYQDQMAASERKAAFGRVSYMSSKPLPPKTFAVGDLITVIVRHKTTYTNSSTSNAERKNTLKAELKDWIRFNNGKLVPDTMPAGDPKIDFQMDTKTDADAQKDRTNEVTTRMTCKVIDVCPNKTLVLQGGPDTVETDGEKQVTTLTGTCRADDVSADNTILSTQLLELNFKQENAGDVRDTANRGWMQKIWDKIRPI